MDNTTRKINASRVGLTFDRSAHYNETAPFSPQTKYPEYQFEALSPKSSGAAPAPDGYELVRTALLELGLDSDNYGKPNWNPLGELISPGDKVVLKPNWVLDKHPRGLNIFSVITHPSIIRAALDYVLIALKGKGKVTVCDAPQADCDFARLKQLCSLDRLRDFYKSSGGLTPEFIDLRKYQYFFDSDGYLKEDGRAELPGDPAGYRLVQLGADSLLCDLDNLENLYGADYDRNFTCEHHSGAKHEYLISATILEADVVVSIPKMKTHKKTGMTVNLKNLVGINGDKNYLTHFRVGSSANGGDEYPAEMERKKRLVLKSQRFLIDRLLVRPSRMSTGVFNAISSVYRKFRNISGIDLTAEIRLGDWHGNDTAWRMVIDLNRILFLADSNGEMQKTQQRKYLAIVDGILAGEGNGPLDPDPANAGAVLAGYSPTSVDIVAAELMGLDYRRMRLYDYIVGEKFSRVNIPYGVASPKKIVIGFDGMNLSLDEIHSNVGCLNFRPHYGWTGHIEIQKRDLSKAGESV